MWAVAESAIKLGMIDLKILDVTFECYCTKVRNKKRKFVNGRLLVSLCIYVPSRGWHGNVGWNCSVISSFWTEIMTKKCHKIFCSPTSGVNSDFFCIFYFWSPIFKRNYLILNFFFYYSWTIDESLEHLQRNCELHKYFLSNAIQRTISSWCGREKNKRCLDVKVFFMVMKSL